MEGDSVDPGEEFAPPLELRELVIRLEKRVLRDVIRVAGLTGQVQGQRIDPGPVLADELVERGAVPGLGSGHQLCGFGPPSLRFRDACFLAQ